MARELFTKVYTRINWKNRSESMTTALGATLLNRMDYTIDETDSRIAALDILKAEESEVLQMVKDWSMNEKTGIITVTKKNGEKIMFDLNIEKIPVSFTLSSQGILTMTTDDGTKFTADIGSMIPVLTFKATDTVSVTVEGTGINKAYSFTVKEGSIKDKHLQPSYLADIKVQAQAADKSAGKAQTEADRAKTEADRAKTEADRAKSSADRTNYGVCYTEGATAAKTVACESFVLKTGAGITVKFAHENKASAPTLDVNNTGAKQIYYKGHPISKGERFYGGGCYTFRYNGTQYDVVGTIDDIYTINDNKVFSTGIDEDEEYPVAMLYRDGGVIGANNYQTRYSEITINPKKRTVNANISGNAGTATKLETARTIDGVEFDGSKAVIHYGTCATAAATAAKIVACTGFVLAVGATIKVKFTVTNSAANPTLNVNGTGAKAIQYRGSAITKGYLAANRTYEFVYDGTNYQLVGDINTDTNTTYSNFVKSGSGAKAGLVPAPSTTAGTSKYLREDGTWQTPPNSTYSAATATPKAAGTAAVGSSAKYAREDHVHPLQTSVSGSSGSCTGNAATATKATRDGDGNVIADTYIKKDIKNIYLEDDSEINVSNNIVLGKQTINGGNFRNSIFAGKDNILRYNGRPTNGFISVALNGDFTGGNAAIFGHYPVGTYGEANGTGTSNAFIIGNGSSASNSNAIRADYNGKMWCKSAYSATGADYAELFEWLDGNPDNEDRRGYFVTMDGEKIKKADAGDWILGIVSANPCVLGNTDTEWQGQFLKDEFGAYLTEEFTETVTNMRYVPEVDEDGNPVLNENGEQTEVLEEYEEEIIGTRYVLNPDYDPDAPYVDRMSRPEWDAVGMIGVLAVRDDGTCKVNGFCSCKDGGIATASETETKYRVTRRINDHVVKVILI